MGFRVSGFRPYSGFGGFRVWGFRVQGFRGLRVWDFRVFEF